MHEHLSRIVDKKRLRRQARVLAIEHLEHKLLLSGAVGTMVDYELDSHLVCYALPEGEPAAAEVTTMVPESEVASGGISGMGGSEPISNGVTTTPDSGTARSVISLRNMPAALMGPLHEAQQPGWHFQLEAASGEPITSLEATEQENPGVTPPSYQELSGNSGPVGSAVVIRLVRQRAAEVETPTAATGNGTPGDKPDAGDSGASAEAPIAGADVAEADQPGASNGPVERALTRNIVTISAQSEVEVSSADSGGGASTAEPQDATTMSVSTPSHVVVRLIRRLWLASGIARSTTPA